MQVVLSQAEEIVEPALHDARLTGIGLLADGSARLDIQRLNGLRVELVMHGVIRLQMDGFCEGNVILDVTLAPVDDRSLSDVAVAYGATLDSSFLVPEVKRLRDLGAVVLRLNPSLGATLVCVCRRIEARDA